MTTTTFYPDVSNHQDPPGPVPPVSVKGALAVCAKATEGVTFTDPDYTTFKAEASGAGVFFFAYHFLRRGFADAQAEHCFAVTGPDTGLMVDIEETGTSQPGIADAAAFTDRYRQLGGRCWLAYLPHWYWQKIGSPSLQPLIQRGMLLVSSNYPAGGYSGNGPGWAPYGGMTPTIWQYTPSQAFNGQKVDFNAYKGTVAQLKSLVLTGKLPPAGPFKHVVPAGNELSLHSVALARNTTVQHISEVTHANATRPKVAVFDAYVALCTALHLDGGLPAAAMPEGLQYWTTNP